MKLFMIHKRRHEERQDGHDEGKDERRRKFKAYSVDLVDQTSPTVFTFELKKPSMTIMLQESVGEQIGGKRVACSIVGYRAELRLFTSQRY